MSPSMRSRSNLASMALALTLGAVALWSFPSSFVGSSGAPQMAPSRTAMKGYRLDWMLFGDGPEKQRGSLEVSEGFFIGERGFMKSQAAQGFRYRMRPTSEEYKMGSEVDNLMWQFGPVKFKIGEAFGGSANNYKLRELKQQIFDQGLTDPKKIAENEYWLQRYGHKRWGGYQPDVSRGLTSPDVPLFRGLAAWSGFDPKNEEKWQDVNWKPPMKCFSERCGQDQFELEDASGSVDFKLPKRLAEYAEEGQAIADQ